MATFKKLITSFEIGADPVSINLTFPPTAALNLLNTNQSYIGRVGSPVHSSRFNFDFNPLFAIVDFIPFSSFIFATIPS